MLCPMQQRKNVPCPALSLDTQQYSCVPVSQGFLMKIALQLLPTSMLLERFRLKSMDCTVGPLFEAHPVMFFILLYPVSREVETN